MTEFVLQEAPDLPDRQVFPDQTILDAEVAKVEVKTAPFTDDDGNPVKQVEFTFEIPGYNTVLDDGRSFAMRQYGRTSTTFSTSERCKLRAWVQEIMSVDELPAGFALDLDDLVGNPCRVILKWKEYDDKKAPRNADGSYKKRQINEVEDVLRAGGQSTPLIASALGVNTDPYGDEEPF